MSQFRLAAVAAIMVALALPSVDAFAETSDAEVAYVDFVSAPADADFGRHSHDGWQHHLAVVRLPHRNKVIVHQRLHPSTVVVRRQSTPVVVASGAPVPLFRQTVAGYPRCDNLGCPGYVVLGVFY
jgi:hypothetical protein